MTPHPRPTTASTIRNVLQVLTLTLESQPWPCTHVQMPRDDLAALARHLEQALMLLNAERLLDDGRPALGIAWGLCFVAALALMVTGLWLVYRC